MGATKANDVQRDPVDGQPTSGHRASILMMTTSATVVGLGVATVYAAHALGVGSLREPGSGLWPLTLGVALIGLGLVTLVMDRRLHPDPFTSRSWRCAIAAVVCGIYVELFMALGPTVPTAMFMFCWLRWLSRRSWRSSLVLSLAITAVMYSIFVIALNISLPTDFFLAP